MKFFKSILLALAILFIPGLVIAAGTVYGSVNSYKGASGNMEVLRITYTVTFGADASSPANVALYNITDSSGGNKLPSFAGWWLLRIDTYPGATAPTANTDLYLWSVEDKIDVLGGNGVDAIDGAATYNSIYPAITSQSLTGAEIFDIDNNAVVNAGCVIIFTLYR